MCLHICAEKQTLWAELFFGFTLSTCLSIFFVLSMFVVHFTFLSKLHLQLFKGVWYIDYFYYLQGNTLG